MQPIDAVDQSPRHIQRTNILEAARRVFARKGKAATMADIAEAAGVSQGLAYRYFAGKEAMYRELVEQTLDQASLASPPSQQPDATPGERLALLITQLVDYRRDHPEFFQLLDQVLSADTPPDEIAELIRQHRERFFSAFRQLIVEGQATGEVATGDPDQLVIAIFACLDGLIHFSMRQPDQFRKLYPDASILLRMLKP